MKNNLFVKMCSLIGQHAAGPVMRKAVIYTVMEALTRLNLLLRFSPEWFVRAAYA